MDADHTPRQGQFLAFVYYYTNLNRVPPAEADMGRYFRVSPPAVHEMVKTLERRGVHHKGTGHASNDPPLAASAAPAGR